MRLAFDQALPVVFVASLLLTGWTLAAADRSVMRPGRHRAPIQRSKP